LSIIADYKRSLKHVEVEEILDLYLYRPLAFALVKAVYRTNITPNQLTLFSMFIGILGGISFGFGHRSAVILGAVLYGVCIVFDCADGQLARLKKNGTRLGRILDGMIDYVVCLSIYLGIGLGLAPESGQLEEAWWLLIVAAGLSNIFHSVTLDYFRNRFIDYVLGSSSPVEDEDYQSFKEELDALKAHKGKNLRKAAIGMYLWYLNLQKKLTLQWTSAKPVKKFNEEELFRKNKAALRGWTFLGSTTGGTLLIVSTLLGRIDFYFWGLIVVGNLWAAVMFVIQNRIDHNLAEEAAS
jgi:hypothetical protein